MKTGWRLSLRLLLGMLLGSMIGYALYFVMQLQGPYRYTSAGAIIGVGTALFWTILRRTSEDIVLTEVTLTVPQFSELRFVVNGEYRRVAWQLFIETITRVATQPLASDQGSAREALNSLYSLFGTCRELLKNMEPSRGAQGTNKWTVEMLGVSMLNDVLRPFLAQWHPALKTFESSGKADIEWNERDNFREQLNKVRQQLAPYARGLGELSGVTHLDHFCKTT